MDTSGTVTFLFTDIEGSTPLWEQHPQAMRIALSQHNLILHQVMAAHSGHVYKIVGDEFQIAFTSPSNAVHAAVEAQRQLLQAKWPDATGVLKVRMGIHTGSAQEESTGDFAATHTLNRVARITSSGYGGQILISLVSTELARDELQKSIQFHDLGEHLLKGLENPEHIYQVDAEGLRQNFPPLKTSSVPTHNLPVYLTTFIGRQSMVQQIRSLVSSSRLVTLTGFGGVGKSRLAVQSTLRLLDDFPGGVSWVELASVINPDRIVDAIAEVLMVREQADRMLIETLENELCQDKRLLILDNCEHLIDASAKLVDRLLRRCPNIKILTTSREPLLVEGEVTMNIPPLTTPVSPSLKPVELIESEAIQLFVERAKAVMPEFELTEANSRQVIQICTRLDGIPLAIELAAARVPVMPVGQIADRLDQVFNLLTSVSRIAVPRHQTLQAAIDWSYQMLAPEERLLFERLSIFAGGWTLEAVEATCTDEQLGQQDILDLLTRLVNKSLVVFDRRPGRHRRYRYLEPIRQYAKSKLSESGQAEIFNTKHLDYFLHYAEETTRQLSGKEQVSAFKKLELESDNLRAAASRSLTNPIKTHENLRLVIALGNFWLVRGNLQEGREWVSSILDNPGTHDYLPERAKALDLAAMLAYRQSDYPVAKAAWEESLQISRDLADDASMGGITVASLTGLAMVASELGDYQTAPKMLEEALVISRQLGDQIKEADILRNLGWAAMRPGDYSGAKRYLEQAAALFRKLDEKVGLSSTISGLGEVALRQGDLKRAQAHLEESLALRRDLENKWGIGATLGTLGWAAMSAGDLNRAQTILQESLTVRQELGDKGGIAWCLEKLAQNFYNLGNLRVAASLFGSADAVRVSINSVIDPVDQDEYFHQVDSLKKDLGTEDFHTFWAEGAGMAVDDAVALALSENPALSS